MERNKYIITAGETNNECILKRTYNKREKKNLVF